MNDMPLGPFGGSGAAAGVRATPSRSRAADVPAFAVVADHAAALRRARSVRELGPDARHAPAFSGPPGSSSPQPTAESADATHSAFVRRPEYVEAELSPALAFVLGRVPDRTDRRRSPSVAGGGRRYVRHSGSGRSSSPAWRRRGTSPCFARVQQRPSSSGPNSPAISRAGTATRKTTRSRSSASPEPNRARSTGDPRRKTPAKTGPAKPAARRSRTGTRPRRRGGPASTPGPGGGGGGGGSLDQNSVERVVVSTHRAGVKRTCWECGGADQNPSVNVTVKATVAPEQHGAERLLGSDDPVVGSASRTR